MIQKICGFCQKEFITNSKTKRFCNCSCAAKWKHSQPEIEAKYTSKETKEARALGLKKSHEEKSDLWENIYRSSSERMKAKNPMSNQESVDKMTNSLKGRPWSGTRGGNGTGMTIPQEILLKELGLNWKAEIAIPTKQKRDSGFPTCYKVDIANETLKIAIEVDGLGHLTKKGIEKDKKKTILLESLGWKVLHFKNQEILENLPKIMEKVRLCII